MELGDHTSELLWLLLLQDLSGFLFAATSATPEDRTVYLGSHCPSEHFTSLGSSRLDGRLRPFRQTVETRATGKLLEYQRYDYWPIYQLRYIFHGPIK